MPVIPSFSTRSSSDVEIPLRKTVTDTEYSKLDLLEGWRRAIALLKAWALAPWLTNITQTHRFVLN